MRIPPLAFMACLLGGSALAEPAQAPPDQPATPVSGLLVMPLTQPPKVAATFPAAGQAITPGVLVLSVTFNERMGGGFDYGPATGGEMPECLKTPRLLATGKTFVLLCSTLPGKTYAVSFNGGGKGGFANAAENRAEAATLTFTTTTEGEPVRSLGDAMKAASLGDADMPVQDAPGLQVKTGG